MSRRAISRLYAFLVALTLLVGVIATVGAYFANNPNVSIQSNVAAQVSSSRNQTSTSAGVSASQLNASITFVKSGEEPDSLALNAANDYLYVANFGSADVTMIDLAQNDTVVGALASGQAPDSIMYDAQTGSMYVTNFYSNNVTVLSGPGNSIGSTVYLGGTSSSLVLDPKSGVVYGLDRAGTLQPLGSSGSTISGSIESGFQAYSALFDQSNNDFYVATSNATHGRIDVLDLTGKNLGEVTVGAGPVALALDPANGEVFVASQESGTVSVIDTATNELVTTIQVDQNPSGICYDASNGYLFETNQGSGTVLAIDGANNTVFGQLQLPLNSQPHSIACSPDGKALYVADWGTGDVAVIFIG